MFPEEIINRVLFNFNFNSIVINMLDVWRQVGYFWAMGGYILYRCQCRDYSVLTLLVVLHKSSLLARKFNPNTTAVNVCFLRAADENQLYQSHSNEYIIE